MTDKPVNLDEHRGMAAQKDTEIRRDLRQVQVDQAALRARQEKLETLLLAAPAATWLEAAAKARYLIELFAATPNAQDPRRRKIIASAMETSRDYPTRTRQSDDQESRPVSAQRLRPQRSGCPPRSRRKTPPGQGL
jgi:hypothetical protein